MATETDTLDRRAAHVRSLTVTAVSTLGGVAAGVLSATFATGATDRVGLLALGGVLVVEFALMYALGVDVGEFSTKDNLYVAFMSLALWFITWAIFLTTGA